MKNYWNSRKDMLYYKVIADYVKVVGKNAETLIDIGSAQCRYLEWFDWIETKHSLDLRSPYQSEIVKGIKADFFNWEPDLKYDLALCLQVLEHIDDPKPFCRKLLSICNHLIISVPYKWKAGSVPSHVQDPVNRAKLNSWMGCKPDTSQIVHEPFLKSFDSRLIAYYQTAEEKIIYDKSYLRSALSEHSITYM